MGASGWSYFVPFQEDINEALQALRWRVFRAGDYWAPPGGGSVPFFEDFAPPDIWSDEEQIARWRATYEEEKALRAKGAKLVSTSPDQLLRRNRTEGTHSIIDIPAIRQTNDLNESGGLSDDELVRCFGTLRPSRGAIEAETTTIQALRGRWRCTYVVSYEGDTPREIFFGGVSGD